MDATLADLPVIRLYVPLDLPRKGRWIDNGPLSNMTQGEADIVLHAVRSKFVEPAYVAAKNPQAKVPGPSHGHGVRRQGKPIHRRH